MTRIIKKAARLAHASRHSIKNDGVVAFGKRAHKKVYYRLHPDEKPRYMRDVLFIIGPHLPQVKRYRVDHQVEQLRANGMTADIIHDDQLTLDDLKYYRGFVFCRYPHTQKAEEFIEAAKSFNKTIVFEIDDLVFDTKFTDNIKTIQEMNKADRELYDSGVNRCNQTLKLCDYAITTTEPLAGELKKYSNIQDVFVNRNIASDAMVAVSDQAINSVTRDENRVVIGYFSGSITHNEDFEMVLPALVRILKENNNVSLYLGGHLDKRPELVQFGERVETSGFVDWQELPAAIRKCDINLAPLAQKTIFNEAKSEIKWLDAALVETMTVASDFGAFHTELKNESTAILVKKDENWYSVLSNIVHDKNLREHVARNARKEAVNERTTLATGKALADWLMQKFAPNVAFVVPSGEISGGVNVVLKHADILRANGKDVTIINAVSKKLHTPDSRKLDGYNEIVAYKTKIEQQVDEMVATLWATVAYVRKSPYAQVKSYFVQNFETDFLSAGDVNRLVANSTYCYDDMKYTTMSLWCKDWLLQKYGQNALYASNGLWSERYKYQHRDFNGRKVRILIEGDPESKWKNVDEAFRITNSLDKEQFEVNFLSYYAKPKDWYEVDNFYQKIPSEKVGEVYANNDILLKTSLLESFSYPPLEMIATGGFAVVIPNGGNLEYLKDEENCLMFESGDHDTAVAQIQRIVSDKTLRDKLESNGKQLANDYSWEAVEDQIVKLYE